LGDRRLLATTVLSPLRPPEGTARFPLPPGVLLYPGPDLAHQGADRRGDAPPGPSALRRQGVARASALDDPPRRGSPRGDLPRSLRSVGVGRGGPQHAGGPVHGLPGEPGAVLRAVRPPGQLLHLLHVPAALLR